MMTTKCVNLALSPPIPTTFLSALHNSNTSTARILPTWNSPTRSLRLYSSTNRTAAVTSPAKEDDDGDEAVVDSAADVVRSFYGGINAHDLASVEDLIADKCVYEDLVFPRPFVGRKVFTMHEVQHSDSTHYCCVLINCPGPSHSFMFESSFI